MKCSLGISNFFEEISSLPFCCFPLFLCINRWGRLSYLFLLFFGTLHSDAYIFPFLLCFSLRFFSQLFVRPPQTAILLFCISFPWGWSQSLSPVRCHERPSIVHPALYQIYHISRFCTFSMHTMNVNVHGFFLFSNYLRGKYLCCYEYALAMLSFSLVGSHD